MQKKIESSVEEDRRYHNTWKLLKNYRDVVWSMELSVEYIKNEFEIEFETDIDSFLEWLLKLRQAPRFGRLPGEPMRFDALLMLCVNLTKSNHRLLCKKLANHLDKAARTVKHRCRLIFRR